jgi:predicted amidophosphoribosyltransferase
MVYKMVEMTPKTAQKQVIQQPLRERPSWSFCECCGQPVQHGNRRCGWCGQAVTDERREASFPGYSGEC